MKNWKKIVSLLLSICLIAACFAGCAKIEQPKATDPTKPSQSGDPTDPKTTDPTEPPVDQLKFEKGTVLRMATGYNSKQTGLFFDAEIAGEGITLADGKTYQTGSLKPTWVEVENRLGMKFENKYQGNSAAKEFEYWQERLGEVDMVSGTASVLTEYGVDGKIVNIAQYLDKMPNFKAYLDANPIVRLSITGDTSNGAIYFSPYFDGVDDIERMPLMRVDWVEKLLNGEGAFAAEKSGNLNTAAYQPYMPTTGKVEVDVVKADGSAVEKVTKDYDAAGNIIDTMNKALAAGTVDGVTAVNMLRTYIDKAYGGYYGTKRADLFIGQNAAWDADELVALLRCVVANANTLNGTDSIQGLFSRQDDNNQRRVDLMRFAGTLFGVRGLESRQDYLFFGSDGKLHDARQEADTYVAIERMNAMVKEGLISKSFVDGSKEKSETMLQKDLGFMSYDYNQTQTVYNETLLQADQGEKYMAVMVPVAKWNDGDDKTPDYFRFTESWRSVKTDGWGISVEGIGNDENKLNACLKLIDYAYSKEGQILMSYGPDAFIKTNADGSYVTFNFNGQEWPVIADKTYEELWSTKTPGNYTNYARQYLGSTLSFAKSQAFEAQCTTPVGKEGTTNISNAIALGVIKHPLLAVNTANMWYTSVPTVLPSTNAESDMIKGYTDLTKNFSTSKDKVNIIVNQIVSGYDGVANAEAAATRVSDTWMGAQYLELKSDAWNRLLTYFNSL